MVLVGAGHSVIASTDLLNLQDTKEPKAKHPIAKEVKRRLYD